MTLTCLATGAPSGIGLGTALALARAGHRVIIHGRSEARCASVAQRIAREAAHPPSYVVADFAHLEQVLGRHRRPDRRASFYGSTRYQTIKNILTQALDLQPMPTTRPAAGVWADGPPRFARTNEWVSEEEGSDERH